MLGRLIAAGAILAVIGTAPAGASTVTVSARTAHTFGVRDRSVVCGYTPPRAARRAVIRCDVPRTRRGVRVAATLTPVGRARLFRPTDALISSVARGVPEGSTLVVGPFRCTVSDGAMVCMSVRSPYGFALSRDRQAPLGRPLGVL